MAIIWITATMAYTGVHPEVLEVVASGRIQGLEDLVTKKICIDDVVEQGIMALLTEKDKQGITSNLPYDLLSLTFILF